MVRAPFVYSHLLLEVWRQQKKKKSGCGRLRTIRRRQNSCTNEALHLISTSLGKVQEVIVKPEVEVTICTADKPLSFYLALAVCQA